MTAKSAENRRADGKFGAGNRANPGGRPRTDPELQALLKSYSAMAIQTLAEIARKGTNERARVMAANSLLDRGLGKPLQRIAGEVEGGGIVVQVLKLTDPSEGTSGGQG
jgi:hypothetical protein